MQDATPAIFTKTLRIVSKVARRQRYFFGAIRSASRN